MAYRRKKAAKSGFKSYCTKQLKSVKLARSAGTRSKSAYRYQRCLTEKHGIKSGAGKVKKSKK